MPGGGDIRDYFLLLVSTIGIIFIFTVVYSFAEKKDLAIGQENLEDVVQPHQQDNLQAEGVVNNDGDGGGNGQGHIHNTNNEISTKKQLMKLEKKRLKAERKSQMEASILAKKEKENEQLRKWRDRYGATSDDDSDSDDNANRFVSNSAIEKPPISNIHDINPHMDSTIILSVLELLNEKKVYERLAFIISALF